MTTKSTRYLRLVYGQSVKYENNLSNKINSALAHNWSLYVGFVVVVLVLCFLHLFIDVDVVTSGTALEKAMNGDADKATTAFAVTLTGAFPLMVDLLLDWMIAPKKGSTASKQSQNPIKFFFLERICTIFALAMPSLTFFILRPNIPRLLFSNIMTSAIVAQRIFVLPPVLSFLSHTNPTYFPISFRTIVVFANAAFNILTPYWSKTHGGIICLAVGCVFGFIGFGLLVFMFARFFTSIAVKAFVKQHHFSSEESLTIAYVVSIVFYSVVLIKILFTQTFHEYTGQTLLFNNISLCIMCILPACLPGRFARSKVAQTEKLLELKQHFVRYISHEMRTPMNVASVGVDLLENSLESLKITDAEVLERITDVKDAINVSIEILNDILTYEKISSQLMTLDLTHQQPVEFISNCFKFFKVEARKKGVAIILPTPDGPEAAALASLALHVDENKMGQVFRNLASNALKFTPAGGCITVKFTLKRNKVESFNSPDLNGADKEQENSSSFSIVRKGVASIRKSMSEVTKMSTPAATSNLWLLVEVIDTGVGIAEHNIHKVFNEIIQFDANKLQGGKGSGLGLYITKGIVDLHKGSVSVKSRGIGTGCTFSVLLPLIPNPELAAPDRNSSIVLKQTYQASYHAASSPSLNVFSRLTSFNRVVPTSVHSHQNENNAVDLEMATGTWGNNNNNNNNNSKSRSTNTVADAGTPRMNSEPTQPRQFGVGGRSMSMVSNVSAGGFQCDLTGMRVLLVDDSPINLKIVAIVMKKLGAICETAVDGAQAVLRVQRSVDSSRGTTTGGYDSERDCSENHDAECSGSFAPHHIIHMVIMDNFMPVMNGPEACKLMRQGGFRSPIFGLTGDCQEEDIRFYMDAGATHVFQKPFNVHNFSSVIWATLNLPEYSSLVAEARSLLFNDHVKPMDANDHSVSVSTNGNNTFDVGRNPSGGADQFTLRSVAASVNGGSNNNSINLAVNLSPMMARSIYSNASGCVDQEKIESPEQPPVSSLHLPGSTSPAALNYAPTPQSASSSGQNMSVTSVRTSPTSTGPTGPLFV